MYLAIQQLSLHAGTRALIDVLDLTLQPGEVLGILGANGAGQSTLLAVLAGLAPPAQGQVTLDGQALDTLPGGDRQLARLAQLAAQQPPIPLLAEPLSHLVPAHHARLLAWARSA